MSFDARQVQFLQRLVAERPDFRRAGAAATHLCEHHGLGTAIAGEIRYNASHHQMAEKLLLSNDLPVKSLGSSASRADAAGYGGMSEKSGTASPHAGSIALRCFGHCTMDGQSIQSPAGAYFVMSPEAAKRVACDLIVFVENLETFRQLEGYRWIKHDLPSVMAVFRGDSVLHAGEAMAFVRARTEPVMAFVDLDPAGLLIAEGLGDRLKGLVLPSWEFLGMAADTLRGRELYDQQLLQAQASLEASCHPAVQEAWEALKRWRCGVTQERMMAA